MTDTKPTTPETIATVESPTPCPSCGSENRAADAFCASCGYDLQTAETESAAMKRRRIGGQEWAPVTAKPLVADRTIEQAARVAGTTSTSARTRKRRRRRRAWYRRPIFVAPISLAVVLIAVAGYATYRAQSTVSALHEVSTPPPSIVDNTVDDDPIYAGVEVDTAPAQAALASSTTAATGSGGGLFGSVRDAASDVSDLANGAAIASGVRDVSTDEMTILLMGVDARPGAPIDIGVRPDSIMLLHINPTEHSCQMLSIPRDTLVNLPGYGETKINHALMVGGIPYQEMVIEQYLGITIDRYALVDFSGFEEMVDTVGGITVTVPQEITNAAGAVLFEAGPQEMNGEEALKYARYRGGADVDVGRVRRQQQIIRALAQNASSRDLVRDVNSLLPAVEGHIRTNLSTPELLSFADQYSSMCDPSSIALDTLQGSFSQSATIDPMFHERLFYNVVEDAVLKEKVAILIGG
ncbi:MAG: LCP family protein [Thermomicrobiales bacterium]